MNSQHSMASDGIHVPPVPIHNCDEEYEKIGFMTLIDMQHRYFWYCRIHQFLSGIVNLNKVIDLDNEVSVRLLCLAKRRQDCLGQIALVDSFLEVPKLARPLLIPKGQRYQLDLMELYMKERWVIFFAGCDKNLSEDLQALRHARNILKLGGYLFFLACLLPRLWSFNDETSRHMRRYRRTDFGRMSMNLV